MLVYICKTFFGASTSLPPEVQTTPQNGCLHPEYSGYFSSPAEYLKWYRGHQKVAAEAPVVAVLLYRKHVITKQPYIPQLISQLAKEGLLPVPIFINGVEAHTIVRDQLTSSHEQAAIAAGAFKPDSLHPDAIEVCYYFGTSRSTPGVIDRLDKAESTKWSTYSDHVHDRVKQLAMTLLQSVRSFSGTCRAGEIIWQGSACWLFAGGCSSEHHRLSTRRRPCRDNGRRASGGGG